MQNLCFTCLFSIFIWIVILQNRNENSEKRNKFFILLLNLHRFLLFTLKTLNKSQMNIVLLLSEKYCD